MTPLESPGVDPRIEPDSPSIQEALRRVECRPGTIQGIVSRWTSIICVSIAGGFPVSGTAQVPLADSAASARVAMDLAIGGVASSPVALGGYKLELSIALPREHALILRYMNVQELCLFDPCVAPGRAMEAAALYGWTPHARFAGATLAAGAGVLASLTSASGSDIRSRDTNPVIPIEIAGYLGSASSLAIGLAGTLDLAPEHSLAGFFLNVRLGFD
jgi:hypothetical protein